MKRKVKSYLVFAPLLYRVVMFMLVPMILIFYYYLVRDSIAEAGLIVVMVMLVMAEIVMDVWLLGGIQSKEAEKLDVLKTSGRGLEVMHSALKLDLVRRFLTIAGIMGICYWLSGIQDRIQLVAVGIYFALIAYIISTLGVLIGRYGGTIWINVAISYFAALVVVLSQFLPGLKQYAVFYDLGLGVLTIVVSIVAVRIAMKKVEGSYYDK